MLFRSSLPAITALLRLADARLSYGSGRYQETIEIMVDAIEQQSSPRTIRLVSEMLELIIITPCPAQEVRLSAAIRLVTLAHRWWNRLDRGDQVLVKQLCQELELDGLLPTEATHPVSVEEASDEWSTVLANRFIALYSLTLSATERAANVIKAACPTVKVKAFCESGNTPSMKDAARTADLFIIATRSAKHAATEAIMQNRVGQPVEYAAGKGSSSIIEALRRWIGSTGTFAGI